MARRFAVSTLIGVLGLAGASSCNEVSGVSGLDFGYGATSSSTGATTAASASSSSAASSAGSSSSGGGTGGGDGGTSTPPTAQALLALTTTCKVVSKADYQNDYNPMAADIPVCGLDGAVFWQAGMSIDCDGASHASAECPSPTSTTAATDSMGHALNSVLLPFVVIPDDTGCTPLPWDYFPAGLAFGSVIAVIYDGQVSYGVFGDTGDCGTIGQASYAMAKSLGIDPGPGNPGVENSVTYIAFVGAGSVAAPIEEHAAAVTLGEQLAATLVANN
jgi:Fungal chitosanase of glycosyl hydrolase group 75